MENIIFTIRDWFTNGLPFEFIIVYTLIIILVCLRVVVNSTTSSKALAYLLLIITFPIIGIVFYLSFGFNYRKNKLYNRKLKIDEKAYPEIPERTAAYMKQAIEENKPELGRYYPIANLQTRTSFISDNNAVKILVDGDQKFDEVFRCLETAKNHIHIEYYIYEDDEIGNKLADILIKKAKEGVKVRFVYDDFGSGGIRKRLKKKLLEAGVETFPFYEMSFLRYANRLNYRNHRKIIVVDGDVGFVGGINVADKYVNSKKNKLFWRDTHLKIVGPSVMYLQFVFLTDWNFCSEQDISFSTCLFPINNTVFEGDKLVQIISSGPDSDYQSTMYSLMQTVMLAKKELLITTPYFIPDKSFLDAIKIAALSGVEVKLLLPGVSDSLFVNVTSESFFSEIMEAGVRIFRYNKGFVHAKTVVCDREVSVVGTANLDNRSFDLNFEINAVVFDLEIAKQMAKQFYIDLKDASELKFETWEKRPKSKILFEKILKLFSALM